MTAGISSRLAQLYHSERTRRVIRFLISGTTAAGVNITILFVLVHYAHIHYLLASILSYLLSIAAGFSLQKFWTFGDNSLHQAHFQFGKYATISILNLGINTLLMYTLVSIVGIWYLLAQFLAGFVIAFVSYTAMRTFVFTEEAA